MRLRRLFSASVFVVRQETDKVHLLEYGLASTLLMGLGALFLGSLLGSEWKLLVLIGPLVAALGILWAMLHKGFFVWTAKGLIGLLSLSAFVTSLVCLEVVGLVLPLYVLAVLWSYLLLDKVSYQRVAVLAALACLVVSVLQAVEAYPPLIEIVGNRSAALHVLEVMLWSYVVYCLYHVLSVRDEALARLSSDANLSQELQERLHSTSQARAYLDNILRSMAEMLIVVDEDAIITMVNRAVVEKLGYAEAELIGAPIEKLFADIQPGKSGVDTLRMQGAAHSADKAMLTKTGRRVPILLSGQVLYNSEQRMEGIVCVIQDVSEIRATQSALQLKNERYNMAIQSSRIVFSDFNIADRTITMDGDSEALFGITVAENSPTSAYDWFEVLVPEDRPMMRERLRAYLKDGEGLLEEEVRFQHRDGKIIWTLLRGRAIRDAAGQAIRFLAVCVDITQRKALEADLKQSISRMQALIEAIPDMMIRTRRDGSYIEVMSGVDHRAALPLEDYQGKSITQVLTGEASRAVLLATDVALRTGQTQVLEHPFTLDGKLRDYEVRTVPFGEDEVLHIVRDVTTRKQIEQHRFELAVEREQIRVLTQFIRDASHEFRTPLTVIKTNVYLLEHSQGSDHFARIVRRIDSQADTLEALVDALLLMAQLDGDVAFEMRWLDLNYMLQDVVALSKNELDGRQVQFEVELDSELKSVLGDSSYCYRALSELVNNAVRYSPENGIVKIRTYQEGTFAVVEIGDRGKGINPTALSRIFERFYREDRSHSTKGFGLGLSIAQKIVLKLGGRVEVESKEGEGSVFRVFLPMVKGSPA